MTSLSPASLGLAHKTAYPGLAVTPRKSLGFVLRTLCDLRHRLARTLDNGPEQGVPLAPRLRKPPHRTAPAPGARHALPGRALHQGGRALPLPGSAHDAEVAKPLERASVDRASVMRYRSLGHLLPTGCAACRPPGFLGPVLAHLRAMVLENQIWAQQFSPALVDAAAMTYVGRLRWTGGHPSSMIDRQRVPGLWGGLDWLRTQFKSKSGQDFADYR